MRTPQAGTGSPLGLLEEWAAGGAALREVLVTGYAVDLAELERRLVPTARGLGARITALSDPSGAREPVGVRHAGLLYQHGHAGAGFEVGLLVLVGDEQVWVAFGAGDAAWDDDRWLVVRSTPERGPLALREFGDWLAELPGVVPMPSWIADAVRVVGAAVRPDTVDDSLPDLRVADRLRRGGAPAETALLGARLTGDTVAVELRATSHTVVESSPDGAAWRNAVVITRDSATGHTVRAEYKDNGNRLLRARVPAGTPTASVFVTDTERCAPVRDLPRVSRDYPLADLFADHAVGRRFEADFLRVAAETEAEAPKATWARDLENALGPSLAALAFPAAWRADGPDPDLVPAEDFRLWRRRADKLRQAAAPGPLGQRLVVAALYATLLAAGAWEGDEDWREVVAEVAVAVQPSEAELADLPGDVTEFAVSLSALCVALLRQDAVFDGPGTHDRVATTAWRRTRDLIPYAVPGAVAPLLLTATRPHARVAVESELDDLVELATVAEDDPDAMLRLRFAEADIPATRFDGAWIVEGEFRNPRRFAARAATLAGSPCAVVARNAKKSTAILRDGDLVAIAESTVRRWRVYRLGPASSPTTLFGGDEALPATREQYPLLPIPEKVAALAAAAGVNPTMVAAALQ
ncbi:hypothetical protein V5P93_002108 [Actinokineospora auranticolor]|uniref:hypothetical protein n=1 Tax=Actinokineospora auranticolor TaxID=155976 RepID=UPI0011AFEDD4|nr:hypothetical protein [Actinokineospora auranticolor]